MSRILRKFFTPLCHKNYPVWYFLNDYLTVAVLNAEVNQPLISALFLSSMEGWKPLVFRCIIFTEVIWVFSLSCLRVCAGPAVSSAYLHGALCKKSGLQRIARLTDAVCAFVRCGGSCRGEGVQRGEAVLCVWVIWELWSLLLFHTVKVITTCFFPVWEANFNCLHLGRSPSWNTDVCSRILFQGASRSK